MKLVLSFSVELLHQFEQGLRAAAVEVAGGSRRPARKPVPSPAHAPRRRAGVRRPDSSEGWCAGGDARQPDLFSIAAARGSASLRCILRINSGIATFSSAVNSGSQVMELIHEPRERLRIRPAASRPFAEFPGPVSARCRCWRYPVRRADAAACSCRTGCADDRDALAVRTSRLMPLSTGTSSLPSVKVLLRSRQEMTFPVSCAHRMLIAGYS